MSGLPSHAAGMDGAREIRSRELYWIDVNAMRNVAGGVTRGAAIMSWNRSFLTIVFNRQNVSDLKRRIG